MGTHARGAVDRAVLGSVAETVLRKASVPRPRRPAGVSRRAREVAAQRCCGPRTSRPTPASGAALRALHRGEVRARSSSPCTCWRARRAAGRGTRRVEERIRGAVALAGGAERGAEAVVAAGSAAGEILALARARAVDLIVLGASGTGALQRLLFGSTVLAVVRQAACPVLVVRAGRREDRGMRRAIPTDRLGGPLGGRDGLTAAAARDRRAAFGPNDIVEVTRDPWRAIVRDTARDPMIWFLVGTGALYAALGDRAEALTLLAALVPAGGDGRLPPSEDPGFDGGAQQPARRHRHRDPGRAKPDHPRRRRRSRRHRRRGRRAGVSGRRDRGRGRGHAGGRVLAHRRGVSGPQGAPDRAAAGGGRADRRCRTLVLRGNTAADRPGAGARGLHRRRDALRRDRPLRRRRRPRAHPPAGRGGGPRGAAGRRRHADVPAPRARPPAAGPRLARRRHERGHAGGGRAPRGVSHRVHVLPRRRRVPAGAPACPRPPRGVRGEHRPGHLHLLRQDGHPHRGAASRVRGSCPPTTRRRTS